MWRKVTEYDLVYALSKKELDAFRASSITNADPVVPQIRATVQYVRGIIRSSAARVKMNSDDETLPESLILPAMDHLRYAILIRMNLPVNESRTKAYENAVQLFRDIRSGLFTPESEGDTTGGGDPAGSPAIGDPTPSRLLD